MLKALLHKQLTELGNMFFRSGKKGKTLTAGGKIGLMLLLGFAFVCFAFGMFGLGMGVGVVTVGSGNDWLYFAVMGMMTLALGVIGSAFSTFGGLYLARDNELLLSMPIPPRFILLSRILVVYLLTLFYTAIVWLPAIAAYFVSGAFSARVLLYAGLLLFPLSLIATTLSCILGFLVALLSIRLKNKNFLTVLITVVILGVYYVFYFRFFGHLQEAMENLNAISEQLKSSLYLFYQLGEAALGATLPFLLFWLAGLVLFALVLWVLSLSFNRIVTINRGEKKAVYKEKTVKRQSSSQALFKREMKRFTSSAAYMLNGGLGLLIMPALSVFALVKRAEVEATLGTLLEAVPLLAEFVPVVVALGIAFIGSTDMISASSVSLEGKSYWITRSLPVTTGQILKAKEKVSLVLSIPVSLVSAVLLGIAFSLSLPEIAAVMAYLTAFNWYMTDMGLALNLKKPVLDWVNEVVPIKQGMSVLFTLLLGFASVLASAALAYWLSPLVGGTLCVVILALLFVLLALLVRRFILGRGCELYEALA